MYRLSAIRTSPRLTRAISLRAPAGSWKWCTATRQATTSKLESANGISSARLTTVGPMPGAESIVTTSSPASLRARATFPPPVATSSAFVPSAHSTKSSRSRPSRCASLCRYASARPDQTSVTGQLHRALRRVEHRRLDVDVVAPCVLEDLPALGRVRPVEANDDRMLDPGLIQRLQHPLRDDVAPRDPREDVEEDRLHLRVGRDHLECVDDALRAPAPAEVAEVRRLPAGERDHVQRRHDQTGPVAEDPDLAVELHVGDALLTCCALFRRVRLEVAHLRDVRVLVERVVVDRELRVERLHLALGRDDQRVDLAEHRVGADERVVELLDDRHDLLLLVRVVDAGRVDEAPRLVGLEALERIDVQPRQRLRPLGRDLLDVDASLLREDEQALLLSAVEGDREVVLARDVGCLLDPELANDVAVDVHAEDRLCVLRSLFRRVGELDPARLSAAAGQHLGLDDDLPSELLGRRAGLLRRRSDPPLGDGNPEAFEELLALVLVEVHRPRDSSLESWGHRPRRRSERSGHHASGRRDSR